MYLVLQTCFKLLLFKNQNSIVNFHQGSRAWCSNTLFILTSQAEAFQGPKFFCHDCIIVNKYDVFVSKRILHSMLRAYPFREPGFISLNEFKFPDFKIFQNFYFAFFIIVWTLTGNCLIAKSLQNLNKLIRLK